MSVKIRLIQHADLPAVIDLQDQCYSDALYEPPALLSQRLASAPQSCWLAEAADGELLAYLFSYPALLGKVTVLASPFAVAQKPELLYLHDIGVSDQARGQGVARALLMQAKQYAAELGLSTLALVAVQGSLPYWHKQGFVIQQPLNAAAEAALKSYTGERAQYMLWCAQ